jgi:hypothetical protein
MSPINPILVVMNNMPEYKQELLDERARYIARINAIDADLTIIERLRNALDQA